MRAYIEAILVLAISLTITLLILAAIFARHPLGANDFAFAYPEISPAVFVEGSHVRPGSSAEPELPTAADGVPTDHCPYLAGLAAATPCPGIPEDLDANACPYLREVHRQFVEALPRTEPVLGQDT
jgi:hypothetical protein